MKLKPKIITVAYTATLKKVVSEYRLKIATCANRFVLNLRGEEILLFTIF